MWVLGALSAFGPLSIDMYLPALPSMARSLDAAPSLTLAIQASSAIGPLAVVLAGGGLALLLVCLFLAASSFGAVTPMAPLLAMQDHPQRAGSASGIFGCTQFLLGAAVAPLAGVARLAQRAATDDPDAGLLAGRRPVLRLTRR